MASKLDEAQQAFANGVDQGAKILKLQRYSQAGAALRARVGPSAPLEEFSTMTRAEINVLTPNVTQLAATTTFANATITIPAVTDRFRFILAIGFEVSNLTSAAGTRLPDGVLVQLRSLAVVTINKSSGKATPQGYMGYDMGAIHAYPDGLTTGVYHTDVQEQTITRLLRGKSIAEAVADPIDTLVPSQGITIDVTGIAGVTVADSASGVQINTQVLVMDFIKS